MKHSDEMRMLMMKAFFTHLIFQTHFIHFSSVLLNSDKFFFFFFVNYLKNDKNFPAKTFEDCVLKKTVDFHSLLVVEKI